MQDHQLTTALVGKFKLWQEKLGSYLSKDPLVGVAKGIFEASKLIGEVIIGQIAELARAMMRKTNTIPLQAPTSLRVLSSSIASSSVASETTQQLADSKTH